MNWNVHDWGDLYRHCDCGVWDCVDKMCPGVSPSCEGKEKQKSSLEGSGKQDIIVGKFHMISPSWRT